MLKSLDTSTVYPFLFFLLVENEGRIERTEINGILDDIESYLLRRAVCGLTNKQYNRFFLMLLRNVRRAPKFTRSVVREELLAGKGSSVRWPNDEEFGRAFVHRPVYRVLKREVVASILNGLEDALWTSKHEKMEIGGRLSIEHVMPQRWHDEWKLGGDNEESTELRDRLIHTFGNLTLVTPSFNTSLSNRAFARKQKELKRIARLLLSSWFFDRDDWDEAGILARGKELFDVSRKKWPHPDSPAAVEMLDLSRPPEALWGSPEDSEEFVPVIELESARRFLDDFSAMRLTTRQ
jgi:hypothetical protein